MRSQSRGIFRLIIMEKGEHSNIAKRKCKYATGHRINDNERNPHQNLMNLSNKSPFAHQTFDEVRPSHVVTEET